MIVLMAPRLGFQGGVERHVFDLARGLRDRGHRVALVHAPLHGRDPEGYAAGFDVVVDDTAAAPLLRDASVVYGHKHHPEHLLDLVPSRARLVIAVHDHDFTCVRSHRYLPLSRTPCHAAPGVACVVHGCTVVRDRSSRAGFRLADPFALARATRALSERATFVAGSAYLRKSQLDAGVRPDRVVVIHPVPPEDAAPLTPIPEEPIAVFAGQIIRGKGLDLLLRAAATFPSLKVLVAGDGNDMPFVSGLVDELGLRGRVDFLGPMPPDRMRDLYDRARVVVVPSRWPEPFGMVGVEAMRRRRTVVAAWHGGIPEWLAHGETGFGFRPGDADDLGVMLERAVAPGDNERMAEAGHRRAAAGFRFETMVEQIERVLGVAPPR
jgi:glycosyltransferase involved in cell wall biosynthesis